MRSLILLSAILVAVMPVLAAAGGDRLQVWRSSYFDGADFRDGIALGKASVYRRNGYLPIVYSGDEAPPNDRLPKGTGALVVHCYIQSSGGKLLSHSGSQPVAGTAITIGQGDRKLAVRSDSDGYVVIALEAGDYEISTQGITRKVTVEKGSTHLLPIRVGRRMVD